MAQATATQGLVRTLLKQAQQQLAPVVTDRIEPWFAPPPEPLSDTLPPRALADPDSKFITVDGVELHYKEAGPTHPGAPAVLLLHGFNGSVFNWRGVMQPLSEATIPEAFPGCRVIAFDRPPFGLSERPLQWADGQEPYSCEGGARLAAGLLDALGVPSAILVGHSMGATVSMEVLKQRPDLVAGLALVSPALPATPDQWRRSMNVGQQLQQALRLALINNDRAGLYYVRKALRKRAAEVRQGKLDVYHKDPAGVEAIIDGYLRPMQADNWDRGSLLSFRSFSFPEVPPYESIAQPVIIIQGEEDAAVKTPSVRQIVERLEARPSAVTEYAEFPKCGHIPMDEYPDKFVDALRPFIEKVLSQQSSAHGDDGQPMHGARQRAGQPVESADTVIPAAAAGLNSVEVVDAQ